MNGIDPDQVTCTSLSDVGRVRETNQDACGEFRGPAAERIFVVADGMGGHRGGETASRVAVETIGARVRSLSGLPDAVLRAAFDAANEAVQRLSESDPELRGMGTTGVALWIAGSEAWVAHAGDSRAYRYHQGRLERLTQDHSVVGELERQGLLTADEAAQHPRRNEILRSIGLDARLEAEVASVAAEPGDCFLLCSDGLTSLVSDRDIETVLSRQPPEAAARVLVELANARGGNDNVTVQVVSLPPRRPRPRARRRVTRHTRQRSLWVRLLGATVFVLALLFGAGLAALWLGVWDEALVAGETQLPPVGSGPEQAP